MGLVLGGVQGHCCPCWPWMRLRARSGKFAFLVFGVFCLVSLLPPLAVWEHHKHAEFSAWLSQATQGKQVSGIFVEDVSLYPDEGSVHNTDRLECYWPKCFLGPPGRELMSSVGDWWAEEMAELLVD